MDEIFKSNPTEVRNYSLTVSGPDKDGDFEFEIGNPDSNDHMEYIFLSRADVIELYHSLGNELILRKEAHNG